MRTRVVMGVLVWSLGCATVLMAQQESTNGRPPVEFLGATAVSGDTPDLSGLTDQLGEGLLHNLVGAFGSGVVYSGKDNLYYACADRGPSDGAFPFRDRIHTLRIEVKPGQKPVVQVTVVGTSLLVNAKGEPFVGLAGAFNSADQAAGMRLDPEGIAVSKLGTLWTCDEYGPWLDEWTMAGKHLRRANVPEKFRVAVVGGLPTQELPPANASGRQANRALEGLSISADGKKMYAIMQGPLIQDHALDATGKRVGINLRLLEGTINDSGLPGAWREYVYRLDKAAYGVNEVLAVGDGVVLVIEKDGKGGDKTDAKLIYRVKLPGATDVASRPFLPGVGLPPDVEPLEKEVLIDMLDPKHGLDRPAMPEKVEALALGPDLPNGRKLLLIASDNDYQPKSPSWVWAFSVDPAFLTGQKAAPAR